jgi:hypothetical protein
MQSQKRELYFVSAVLTATLIAGGFFAYRHRAPSEERVAAHASDWFDGPRAALKVMMERHGPPNALGQGTATWYERGPWKRITLHGREQFNCLEQSVSYHVPAEAVSALGDFGHGLRFDLVDEELTATSNAEELNILALNLAVEVTSARRGAEEASDLYVRTARLSAAGKSSQYVEKLMFEPMRREPRIPWNREIAY